MSEPSSDLSAAYGFAGIAKKCIYNRFGQIKQVFRLVLNNVLYPLNSGTEGAIKTDARLLDWYFVCPDNWIDFDTLSPLTLYNALTTVADQCRLSPVPKWEAFNTWLSEPDGVTQVNQIFVNYGITADFEGCDSMAELILWIRDLMSRLGDTSVPMSTLRTLPNKYSASVPLDDSTQFTVSLVI